MSAPASDEAVDAKKNVKKGWRLRSRAHPSLVSPSSDKVPLVDKNMPSSDAPSAAAEELTSAPPTPSTSDALSFVPATAEGAKLQGLDQSRHSSLARVFRIAITTQTALQREQSLREEQERKMENYYWLSTQLLQAALVQRRGRDSWQVKWFLFTNSITVQWAMIGLLLLDVLFVFAELFIESEFPSCRKMQKNVMSCCAAGVTSSVGGGDVHHHLHGHSAHAAECDAGLAPFPGGRVMCDPHDWEGAHTAHAALDFGTLCILTIFEMELAVLLAALQDLFFRHWVNILDLFVITSSLVIQAYILLARWNASFGLEEDVIALEDIQGLILFARFWRFVRVGHGIASSMHDMLQTANGEVHERIGELRNALKQLEHDMPAIRGASTQESMQNVHRVIRDMSHRFH